MDGTSTTTSDAVPVDAPTILIVDDYSDTRTLLAALLRRRGYTVIEAANGKEAILIASRHHPDLILMDLAMPEMDGVEAVRRIRHVPKLATTMIFITSAYVTEEVRADVIAAGCADVFIKPLDTDALLKRIENALCAS